MPEDALRDVVPHDHLANVLTLGMSLNYQRHAYALWKAIALTFDDPATSGLLSRRRWRRMMSGRFEPPFCNTGWVSSQIVIRTFGTASPWESSDLRPQDLQLLAVCSGAPRGD